MASSNTSTVSSKEEIPQCFYWSVEEVAEWIESIGLKQYRTCFTSNNVCGRKLIWVDASNLPRLGVQDWKHIQLISGKVREMLGIEEPYWNKSITLPPRCKMGTFLERKSFTGRTADRLTLEEGV